LERLFPSLLQHSIGLNQEERATLQLQPVWELLVDFYQTAFPMALICYGIKNDIRLMVNSPDYPLEQVPTGSR
jgi:hypothetical protein